MNKNSKFSKIKPILWVIIALFTVQCFSQSEEKSAERNSNFYYLKKLNSVFDFVQQNYVDDIDPKVLYEGAIKGLMNAFNDPYTSYLDTSTIRDLADTTQGKFGGVGLSITKAVENTAEKPAYVEVASPIENSPGFLAGIEAGDYLTKIGGEDTSTLTMEEVLDRLRGEVGTTVNVTVLRGKALTFSVDLTRALIEVPTIKFGLIKESKKGSPIGYVRIIQFTPETPVRFQEALDFFTENNYKKLIVDVRDNPGGLITSVVEVANKFIESGPIVSTKSRLSYENVVYNAKAEKKKVYDIPVVVLINHGSASASEILSGALKDNHIALLVGKNTYGKGSVQQVIPLTDSEELKLTMARYYTPSDTNIDKVGISPDLEVGYSDLTEEEEAAYAKMIKDGVLESYTEGKTNIDEEEVTREAEELQKEYALDIRLLKRLVRVKANKTQVVNQLYDFDYDIQLKKAVEVLNSATKEEFNDMLQKAKTLKEAQELKGSIVKSE